MPKLFGLDSGTVRRIQRLFALDGATPRRVKKLFGDDGGTIRLLFEDKSTFTVSGTANEIVSPVNEVVDFGVRSDFDAGGTDSSVNTSGTGDASNVGSISGLTVDVDSNHTYTADSNLRSPGGATMTQFPSGPFSQPGTNRMFLPTDPTIPGLSPGQPGNARENDFAQALGGTPSGPNYAPGSYITINGSQEFGSFSPRPDGLYIRNFPNSTRIEMFSPNQGRVVCASNATIGPMRISNGPQVSATGRRARVQNGTGKTFTINSGGLTAGGSFATGNLADGASTSFVTANSTSEAWSLAGVITQNPATFSITNADATITVSGTFADGETASDARDRIQAALNANSTFVSKFDTGTDSDKTIGGVAHKVVTFTSDSAENTSDFSITITQNDGSNTTPYEDTTTQGATESLQTTVTVSRDVAGSNVSTATAISSLANTDTSGAAVASNAGYDVTYDSGTNKLSVTDQDATVTVTNPGSLSFSKD
jgi:hypothetical protein